MAHRHGTQQLRSYGEAYSRIVKGRVVYGHTRHMADVAAVLAAICSVPPIRRGKR